MRIDVSHTIVGLGPMGPSNGSMSRVGFCTVGSVEGDEWREGVTVGGRCEGVVEGGR